MGAGIPVLLFAILFSILLIKGWNPTSRADYIGICVGLVLLTLLSAALIQSVSTQGWANEKITSDSLKITADEKYEYRVDLIKLFQRNSHARLYLKDVDSGEEMYIPIDIKTRKIVVLGVNEVNHWVKLEATDNSFQYILYTTKELGIPEEKFEIDIKAGTSTRLE
ncbi:copper transporter family protein [Paenibacillus thiaminolyticus]|nr:copper transporter family protein [Paenibacillus thiaminolyticus]